MKNEKISRLRANTLANAAIIANSQLSANIGPSKGISFINGVVKGAKTKARMDEKTHPIIAIISLVRPRAYASIAEINTITMTMPSTMLRLSIAQYLSCTFIFLHHTYKVAKVVCLSNIYSIYGIFFVSRCSDCLDKS